MCLRRRSPTPLTLALQLSMFFYEKITIETDKIERFRQIISFPYRPAFCDFDNFCCIVYSNIKQGHPYSIAKLYEILLYVLSNEIGQKIMPHPPRYRANWQHWTLKKCSLFFDVQCTLAHGDPKYILKKTTPKSNGFDHQTMGDAFKELVTLFN